jgi:hypothetical protein
MRARRGSITGVAVVVGYALLLAVVAVVALRGEDSRDLAAGRFVSAYEHSRLGTYAMEATFTRRSISTDAAISSDVVEAQRPPNRVRAQFGGVQGQLDDITFVCGPVVDSSTGKRCAFSKVAPFDEVVADDVAVVRSYVGGDDPLYTVVQDGGCFSLRRTRYDPRPPYGEEARLCFDRTTGALVRARIRNTGVIDETNAVEVRPHVGDSELRPPEPVPQRLR